MSETTTAPAETFDPGPRPDLRWVACADCKVDHSYQRTLESERSKKNVARIAKKFRWSAFQAVLVTPAPDGGYLILDGQHRWAAAVLRGILEIPAVVVETSSVAEQAEAFVTANRERVTVNSFALHHAMIVAGDERATDISRICRIAGITIPRYPIQSSQLKPGQTLALGTIDNIAKGLGVVAGGAMLKAIAAAWGSKPGYLRASLFRAFTEIVDKTPIAERQKLYAAITDYLAKTNPENLFIRAYGKKIEGGVSEARGLALVIQGDMVRRAGLQRAA
jgi:hypothetical protein